MTPRRKPLAIGGERVRPGEMRELRLPYGETYFGERVSLPVFVIRAKKAGPRVLISSAIHGDEMNGMGVVRELLFDQPPRLKAGSLILVPVVNLDGFDRNSRYMADRRDLNRSFPGTPSGSLTSRLAHALFSEIVLQCDYCIDFHSAAARRTNYPNVRGHVRNPAVKRLAQAFGCELIVQSQGPVGSLRRTATEAGVPTIILEAGEVSKIEPGVVEAGVRGVTNVLQWLDMLAGKPRKPAFQVNIERTTWVRAGIGGLLSFHVRPGEIVSPMDCLASVSSVFGMEQSVIVSPDRGIVLGMTTMPAVRPGDPVYHIARLGSRGFNRARRALEAQGVRSAYQRMQRDLATNVVILESPQMS